MDTTGDRAGAKSAATTGEIDIPAELQAEIRELARALPRMDFYQVLGIERGAEAKAVREAFFERSRRFHPDRYFRKHLGPYRDLLTEIYKRVVTAHEMLRDPELRSRYDRTLGVLAEEAAEEPKAPPGPSLRTRRGLRTRDQLLSGLRHQLERSRGQARRHYDEAMAARERGDAERALASLRLAITFDPREPRYQEALGDVRLESEEAVGARLVRNADVMLRKGHLDDAVAMLRQAVELRPADARLAARVGALLMERNAHLDLAVELTRSALATDEKSALWRKQLGLILKARGDLAGARRELQRAWELDPLDREVKAELGRL